ncbi:MAG: two-component sensor histidine kinase [Candidatus Marinimicrobia bacterium]|nr:two-component sensor histidine kinase [Candidatus Neomarinimicrobiota bacterium]
MNNYKSNANIKLALFIFGLLLILGLLAYSNFLVNQLRNDNRQIVKIYSEIIAKTVNEDSDANLNFVFDEIIKKIQFPIIYSDAENKPIYYRNIDVESLDELVNPIKSMDIQNKPISIIFKNPNSEKDILLGYLHYGDSNLIQRIKWLPFIEISVVALFIFVGFIGFNSIRNNEKRNLLIGMARETAHQLGTPVSALMGWVDRIKNHPGEMDKVLDEMHTDLNRLKQIGDRFSKMGSDSPLEIISLKTLIDEQSVYLEKRLPSLGKTIELSVSVSEDINILGNRTLLGWAIENIIRNGIDSITGDDGKVQLSIIDQDKFALIHIKDNGNGIPKKDWMNIFSPGFSTKKIGWGLGLSLVNRIINDIHSGKIKIISSNPKEGTVFEIRLNKAN